MIGGRVATQRTRAASSTGQGAAGYISGCMPSTPPSAVSVSEKSSCAQSHRGPRRRCAAQVPDPGGGTHRAFCSDFIFPDCKRGAKQNRGAEAPAAPHAARSGRGSAAAPTARGRAPAAGRTRGRGPACAAARAPRDQTRRKVNAVLCKAENVLGCARPKMCWVVEGKRK